MHAQPRFTIETPQGRYDIRDTGTNLSIWFWKRNSANPLQFVGTADSVLDAQRRCVVDQHNRLAHLPDIG
jgi:hypothetical protein